MPADASHPKPSDLRRMREFVDDLLIHQMQAWERRKQVQVEWYLARYHWLEHQPELLLDLIDQEILLKEKAGGNPLLDDYIARFPALSQQLAIQFAFHRMLPAQVETPLKDPGLGTADLGDQETVISQPVPKKRLRADGFPEQLGTYRLLDKIGSGAMGTVYQVEDTVLHRRLALKVIRPELSDQLKVQKRFLREARAIAALDHENVVSIYQAGEDSGFLFLVMPSLRGETLASRLRREGTLSIQETLRIGSEVCAGLAAAHARGLLHRDIKPANLWLEEEVGRVKILDFGLVQVAGGDNSISDEGVVLGTPAYMSPEQAECRPVNEKSDLFSVGCVLYHALVGEPPCATGGLMATLIAVANCDFDSPRQRRKSIPSKVSDALMQLLSRDPAQRPQSAAEARELLINLSREIPESHLSLLPFGFKARWIIAVALMLIVALGVWFACH